jgi:hypothetical protein
MRKWLVGLMAAGLCAASAWAESVTYTVKNKAVTITEGTAPEGSTAAFSQTYSGDSGQATAGDSLTLTLTGYEGATITGLTLSMRSNAGRGAGSLSATCGDAVIASIAAASFSDESWHGSFSSSFVPVAPKVTATTVGADDVVIRIAATTNSLFVQSYTIEYVTGPLEFAIGLDPAGEFTVVQGEEASITAIPQYAQGEVTYVWGAEGVPGSVEGNVFRIDSTEVGGPYTVTCDANDGTSDAARQAVVFSIVAPPAVYDVEVVQSAGGTVSVEPASGTVGTEVTVTAEPDEGYRLVEILVDGVPLPGTTFPLPEGGAAVSATFEASPERTATYTVASKTEVTESGDVPEGSSATYAQTANNVGQITSNNTFKLTLQGYDGATITGLVLSMHSNGNKGAGSLSVTCGDAIIAAIDDAKFSSSTWNGAFTTSYVDITPAVTPTLVNGDVVLVITGSENSLYCQSVAVTYEIGSAMFSVVLDPAEAFEVTEGDVATVTATPRNASGEVTYAWTVDGVAAETDGPVLALPTGGLGEHVVVCVATDTGAEGVTDEATVKYTVAAAPQAYTVTVAGDIENGSVEVYDGETRLENPAEVLEGTPLKVVATPASRSYKVESITVTGETSGEIAMENDEFTMPAENVSVTATFAERTQTAYSLVESMDDFEAGADYLIVAGTDALKNESDGDRIASTQVDIDENDTVETEDGSIVWTIAAGANGKYTLYNAAAKVYVSAPSYETTGAASLVDDGSVAEAQWTLTIDEASLATIGSVYDSISLQRNTTRSYFAAYKGGIMPSLYKKVGAGVFSIALDPADEFDVPEGTEATITASAKNAQGEVTYTWSVTQDDTPGSANGNVWTIPADAPAGGPWTVYCAATDGTSEAEDRWVSFSIVAAPVIYDVTIAENIENGTVTVDPASGVAGTEITVTATPDAGFALVDIFVDGVRLEGNTFNLPEGGATVSAEFEALPPREGFVRITSLEELEEGEYVLVGSDKNGSYGAVAELNNSVLSAAVVSIKEETDTVENPADSQIWTLSQTEGGWTIYHKDLGYLGYTGSKNTAMAEEEASDKSTWTFSMAGDLFKVSNVGTEGRTLRYNYNNGSPRFACYSSDTLVNIALYKNFGGAFSVALDPADDFEVIQNDEASVTATAKNAAGEVTYAWTVDGVAAETDGPVLALPTGELGEHVVLCVATDTGAEGVTAEASVKYTVVEPPPPPAMFSVTVAEGIENGEVSLSVDGEPLETPAEVEEGTVVTVTATPADGYELEAITVNGTGLEGTTFTVAGDSEISATFAEVVDYATLPFREEDTPYAGPWKNARVTGLTHDGLDDDYSDGAAKFIAAGNWMQVKFAGTPGTLTYNLKGNGTTAETSFEVQESASGVEGSWTPLATYTGENALPTAKTEFSHELSADSRYVRFLYVTKKGNVALYDIYISSGAFSVAVDKTGFELEEGTADTVTAAAKNGTGPYAFVWTSETAELNGEGAELAIPATLATGEYAATVTATDADGQTATADVAFTVVEPAVKYPVEIAIDILNGTVEADVDEAAEGETVTLTAIPAPGFKLGILTVSYGGENLEFTSSPATFTMPADGVLVGASFVQRGDEFVKITSVDDLEEGEYVITGIAPDGEYAMLAELSDGNKVYIKQKETPEEIEGNAIAGPEVSIVWTLAKTADGWTIHNDAIGYVGYLASDNTAGAEAEASDKSTWTISASNGLFLVQNVANTGRLLLYNADATRFACYTSVSSTSKPLAFYKKSGPAVFAVSVDKTGFELVQGEAATVTATARNGAEPYSFVWTSETEALNGEGAELAIPGTLEPGEYSAMVTATDSSVEPQTATAEVAFTVVAPLPVYTVTVAEGIENGTVTVDKTEAEEGETVTVTATPADNYKLLAILVNGEPIGGNTFAIAGDSVVSAEFAEIVKYPVIIADGILNGTVEADKEEAEAGETVTLTATPADGYKLGTFFLNTIPFEGNTFAMPEGEAQITAEFVETVKVTFVPVESEDEFVVGEEYLLVAVKEDAYTNAMKNVASGTRIGVGEVEIAEDGSIETDNADIVWTIRAGEGEGLYVLFSETGNVYAAGPNSAGNGAQLVEDGTVALAQWELDFAALPSIKIKSVSYSDRWLQRNKDKGNAYFATYNTEQATPLLYKKAGFAVTLDKEDGFTVEAGTADSITATALRGTEPYSYVWTGDLEGEGATLAIPADLAQGEYTVKVTATDSSEPALTAEKEISFTVIEPVVRYAITVAEGIVGGEVAVDKELAEAGETVTVTATPASGYELVAITVNGTPIEEGNTFTVEGDSVVSATFNEIVDYARLPFVSEQTPYNGPWYKADLPVGMTSEGLGSDYGDGAAKLNDTGDWIQVKFAGTPGKLSYWIKGNGIAATEEKTPAFAVQESVDGLEWTDVAVYRGVEELAIETKAEYTLSEDSRFVRFFYTEKAQGNVGINDIYIGVPGELEPAVTVTGETALTLGGTFALELALENYSGGEYAWAWEPATLDAYVVEETSTWWWKPTVTGVTEVAFSAVSGSHPIASATVTLTVAGEEPPVPVPVAITKMEIDAEGGWITIWYTGDGTEVWGTDDLADIASWAPVEAAFEDNPEEGKKALVEMDKDKHFIRVQ